MNSKDLNINYRIAQLEDVDAIYEFEVKLKFSDQDEEFEKMIAVWSSAYRKESLEHYFKLGWSFIATNSDNKIVGFFLGQPLLFFDQQTQTLWIEHISSVNSNITTELIEIAYKLSREKHFQRVLLSENLQNIKLEKSFPFQKWDRSTSLLKTTK
ncbi:MAG: hypothetical protein WA160_16295 [Pseudobdellovibrio sp.]